MNREQQMDSFLQTFAKIYAQNPNSEISKNTLYSHLSKYGLTEDEIENGNISHYFGYWEEIFKTAKNLRAFTDNSQPGFLQFWSHGKGGRDHVKLYLSFPQDNFFQCANMIFDFINENNIPTQSKVSYKLRSDSVVLRLMNFNDAATVINYINKTPEIYSHAKNTNPFSPKHGVVAYAYDDMIGFNGTLALIMEKYFIEHKNNNTLSHVSAKDFRNFTINYYNQTFISGEKLTNLTNSSEFKKSLPRLESIGHTIVNYADVTKLITLCLDPSMDIEKFRVFYNEVSDKNNKNKRAAHYNDIMNRLNYQQNYQTSTPTVNLNTIQEQANYNARYTTFENACIATFNKYGAGQLSGAIIKAFDNNFECFTNTENRYRAQLVSMNLSTEEIMHFCDDIMNKYANQPNFANAINNAKNTYSAQYSGARR